MTIQNWPKTSEETEKYQTIQTRIQLRDMILCNLNFVLKVN